MLACRFSNEFLKNENDTSRITDPSDFFEVCGKARLMFFEGNYPNSSIPVWLRLFKLGLTIMVDSLITTDYL